jgi:hypothetical protein
LPGALTGENEKFFKKGEKGESSIIHLSERRNPSKLKLSVVHNRFTPGSQKKVKGTQILALVGSSQF